MIKSLRHITALIVVAMTSVTHSVYAQETSVTANNGWALDVESQASYSDNKTPLWLNANKYGMSSLNGKNGYVRALGAYDYKGCDEYLDFNAGMDVIVPIGYKSVGATETYTTHVILQQCFAELSYKLGTLTIGAKHQPMELKNNELSSGSQTLGINARPVPQLRLGLNDYWNIPFTKKWLSFKGHISYGMMTDGSWEEKFAAGSFNKYNKNVRYHEKAGYLRIGNDFVTHLSLTLGLEMAGQFGGTLSTCNAETGQREEIKLPSNLKSYWNVFSGFTSADQGEAGTAFQNAEGNILGSWVARLDWNDDAWEWGLYWDHFFEDHSGMFFLDYDGYGSGSEWNTKKERRYFRYSMKDMLLGMDLKLRLSRSINQIVVEYLDSRYQSGPIYHDHNQSIQDHISGRDQYYNHYCMPGWQHWGQVMGNPLYLSPLYNTDGYIGTECNRFYAWHLGLAGDPTPYLHYRVKATYQKGYGTYDNPYCKPLANTSVLVEVNYQFQETSPLKNFSVGCAFGGDYGGLRGNNTGGQITVRYKVL